MDIDLEVKGADGYTILSEKVWFGRKGNIKLEDNTAESPVGFIKTTPEMESGEYTIELTVRDKLVGFSASKSFT